MLNHRISSFCDFGSSIIAAATTMTKAVSVNRRIEVPGSSDNTTVRQSHDPNSTNGGVSSEASPRKLSRIARISVSIARPPNNA